MGKSNSYEDTPIIKAIDEVIKDNPEANFNTITMSFKCYLDILFTIMRNDHFFNTLTYKSKWKGLEIVIANELREGMFIIECR